MLLSEVSLTICLLASENVCVAASGDMILLDDSVLRCLPAVDAATANNMCVLDDVTPVTMKYVYNLLFIHQSIQPAPNPRAIHPAITQPQGYPSSQHPTPGLSIQPAPNPKAIHSASTQPQGYPSSQHPTPGLSIQPSPNPRAIHPASNPTPRLSIQPAPNPRAIHPASTQPQGYPSSQPPNPRAIHPASTQPQGYSSSQGYPSYFSFYPIASIHNPLPHLDYHQPHISINTPTQ